MRSVDGPFAELRAMDHQCREAGVVCRAAVEAPDPAVGATDPGGDEVLDALGTDDPLATDLDVGVRVSEAELDLGGADL